MSFIFLKQKNSLFRILASETETDAELFSDRRLRRSSGLAACQFKLSILGPNLSVQLFSRCEWNSGLHSQADFALQERTLFRPIAATSK